MKTLAVLLMLVSSAMAQPAKARVYQVSKAAGDPELIEVFAKVASLERQNITTTPFEVSSKIDASTYVVWKRKTRVISMRVDRLSRIGGYNGGSAVPTTEDYTDLQTPYLLVLDAPINAATGEIIAARCTETSETRNISGDTLRVLKAVAVKDLTKEEFVAMLKAGRTWNLYNYKRISCFDCGGDGKLTARGKTEKCAGCDGIGSTAENWIVKW